ncbi:2-dehydropantoate 2-reductase [Evansella tamaricis]|uniref:2-dehydropantoate 2-reductase n=1 Tax=Evansella tamaricis TaxID=2069301 RepID=A0ABS6JG83_9BACI|nr:2-dehydropantoate 2-reductase [Evansella tamaricis]MBU9712410.1 2-dehydropantoate 2-reductase [Evansella tamaricis]
MRVSIIGAGAIGLLTASHLSFQGYDVQLITRTKEQAEKINEYGITLKTEGQSRTVPIFASNHVENRSFNDLWIITLKQWKLKEFFRDWENKTPLPQMLFLQNGMGHLEAAESFFPSAPLFAGIVTHGAMKLDERTVRHTGIGEIIIGTWKGSNSIPLMETHTKPFPILWSHDILKSMKQKLLVNLVVNPLTALYGVNNGELLTRPALNKNVYALFKEGIMALELPEGEWGTVLRVIQQTAENESSMLRDIKQERSTEIESITGYVLKLGEQKGLHLPITSFVHQSILGLERRGKDE